MELTENQKLLVYWITEREKIRVKKEKGYKRPWTRNHAMSTTYFCNVDREDDKVTRWIRENTDPTKSNTYLLVWLTACRLFNLPSTLEHLKEYRLLNNSFYYTGKQEIHKLVKQGKKVFNGAYIVSTNGKKENKVEHCFSILEDVEYYSGSFAYKSLYSTHAGLMSIDGLGSFLAAQIVADLKNTKGHPLQKAHDWYTFSAHGPGSLRGLSWYFDEKITPSTYQSAITKVRDDMDWVLPDRILNKLCMQNMQNCMCEYDKFMRVTTGTGKSKRHYRGGVDVRN